MLKFAKTCKSFRSRQELSNGYVVCTCKNRRRYSRDVPSEILKFGCRPKTDRGPCMAEALYYSTMHRVPVNFLRNPLSDFSPLQLAVNFPLLGRQLLNFLCSSASTSQGKYTRAETLRSKTERSVRNASPCHVSLWSLMKSLPNDFGETKSTECLQSKCKLTKTYRTRKRVKK